MSELRRAVIMGAVTVACSGCAVHYYDRTSGTEHLWGFGHMKMKVCPPEEGVAAVLKGTTVAGVAVGTDEDGFGVTAGWENRRRLYMNPTNASIRFEWPDGDLFNVRIGSLPPFYTNSDTTQLQPTTKPN